MNEVSLNTLLALPKTDTAETIFSGSPCSSPFAALLAGQLAGNEDGNAAALASLTDMAADAETKKEMIMNLCLMCANGGANPVSMGLFSQLSGGLGIGAGLMSQGLSSYSLLSLMNSMNSASNPTERALGQKIADTALTRLGDPYSKTYRGQGDYVDCSSLVQWAYKQVGISLPGTSVKQAQYCYDNGMAISKEELQPGDLIFWSNTASTDGRWRDIHHVGIYAGNGKVIEAKTSTGGVVIDDIWGENGGTWKIAMYARPYAAANSSVSVSM